MSTPKTADSVDLEPSHPGCGLIASPERFLREIKARGFSPSHILDVGANVGGWSAVARDVFPDAAITMIEPQEHLAETLSTLCHRLGRAVFHPVAAGARFEQRDLHIRAEDPSSTFCDVGEYGDPVRLQPTTIVPLDSLLERADITPAELIKVDTEGFEMEVFAGAQKLLSHAEVLVVEVSLYQWYPMTPRFVDVVSYLAERGFAVYDFCGFLRRPLDGALGITDVCFVREDSPLRASHRWTDHSATE